MEQGKLDKRIGNAIIEAAQEVIDGKLDDNFPLVVWAGQARAPSPT